MRTLKPELDVEDGPKLSEYYSKSPSHSPTLSQARNHVHAPSHAYSRVQGTQAQRSTESEGQSEADIRAVGLGVSNLSVSARPTSVATPSTAVNENSNAAVEEQRKVVTIGISGCSSSGKTTLSLLLREIFSGAPLLRVTDVEAPDSFTAVDDISNTVIIHEDKFFHPKNICPLASFTTTHAGDVQYIKTGLYVTNADFGYIIKDIIACPLQDPNFSRPHRVKLPEYGVTGPNTDCWAAINLPKLIKVIEEIRSGNAKRSKLARRRNEISHGIGLPFCGNTDTFANMHLIASERARVEKFFRELEKSQNKRVVSPLFCIVEGFLLYSMPHIKRDELGRAWASDEGHFERREEELERQKKKLRESFDVKLFLPVSKEEAGLRRASKWEYWDAPFGKRIFGEMWKTDGYFQQVAWPSYEMESGWIFKWGQELGINVRECNNDGVEDTVRWAVDATLRWMQNEMGKEGTNVAALPSTPPRGTDAPRIGGPVNTTPRAGARNFETGWG